MSATVLSATQPRPVGQRPRDGLGQLLPLDHRGAEPDVAVEVVDRDQVRIHHGHFHPRRFLFVGASWRLAAVDTGEGVLDRVLNRGLRRGLPIFGAVYSGRRPLGAATRICIRLI
jgi:hypothetical protein